MAGTPKNSESVSSKEFSPIELPQSPAAVSSHKNLVGYPRLVRDIAADTYNSIQHWNKLHVKGATIVKDISLLKCDNIKLHPEGLEHLTDKLHEIIESLNTVMNVFEGYCQQLHSIMRLNQTSAPLFISWPAEKMYNVLRSITDTYTQERKLKEFIADNLPHIQGKDKLMFYAACWTYQPYITSETDLLLESFLTETGHRIKS